MLGDSLGHYKILEPLGAGGMGEVWLAADTRLGRQVALKVLHRDLKPANIMVTDDGQAKVLDFGLAKLQLEVADVDATSAATDVSRAGQIMGTPRYMAPEQSKGEEVGCETDVFALGVILYEMATSVHPFAGNDMAELVSSILRDDPPEMTDLRPELPEQLVWTIRRCLLKDRQRRLATAADLCARLQEIRESLEAESRAPDGTVAVLPFRDLGGGDSSAHIGLGVADATIAELARFPTLTVRPTAAVIKYAEEHADPVRAGRELTVSMVVDGSSQRAGDRLRVTAHLINVAKASSVWSTTITATSDDIFEMQDEISRQIAEALGRKTHLPDP